MPGPTPSPALAPLLSPQRPRAVAVLPLLHVAWADGILTAGERRAFADRLLHCPALDDDDREALLPWLDPADPPGAPELEELRARIRELAPPESAQAASLTELGLDLAGALGTRREWRHPEARGALAQAEATLGLLGGEAVRGLLGPEEGTRQPSAEPLHGEALFDVGRLTAFLAEPWPEQRAQVMDLLAEPVLRPELELSRSEYRAAVLRAVHRLADEGLGGLAFPRELGGADSPGRALAVFETLAFGDLSVLVKYGVQFGLFGGSVFQLGTARHHRRWLPAIASLELPGCYAMTEIGHGSNVRDLETTAHFDPATDEFVIHSPGHRAGKEWIGNAALDGRMATVFAQLEVGSEHHGVHAFLVPIRDDAGQTLPGVRIEDNGPKEGLNGVDNGRIWLDRVRVPRENLLNRFADVTAEGEYRSPIPSAGRRFFTMLGTLVAGRISIAAASVSAVKTGLTVAVRYSCRRRQFGPEGEPETPILHYLTQQRLLLPALARTYALHFAVRDLAVDYEEVIAGGAAVSGAGDEDRPNRPDGARDDDGPTRPDGARDDGPTRPEPPDPGRAMRELGVRAAGLKAEASWHCIATLQACREAMGGRGYHAANRLARLKADTDVFATFEGANVVLLLLVAKGLLTRYREEMGELRMWDIIRYLADRAETSITELNPVQTRRTDPDHLRDPDWHAAAFRYREERLLASVARRLKGRIDDGVDSFEALNQVQDHLVTLARAHVDRLELEAFQRAVVRAPTPGLSETLRSLANLHALSRLEAHHGWFLETGYFAPPKARAVRDQVNRLCGEVVEQAVFLVEAFGIPDEVLRAPDAARGPDREDG